MNQILLYGALVVAFAAAVAVACWRDRRAQAKDTWRINTRWIRERT